MIRGMSVSHTLSSVGDRLGFGVSAAAYPRGQVVAGLPSGTATTTATTDATTGNLTFTGLTEETDYVAYVAGHAPISFSTRTREVRPRFMRSMDVGDVPEYGADGQLSGTAQSVLAVDSSGLSLTTAAAQNAASLLALQDKKWVAP